jgi:type I restriction enzyme S subunit
MSSNEWKYIDATTFCGAVTDGTHDSPKRESIGKPLITSKHIKGWSIDFENAYLISENDYNKINQRSKVHQWNVLISMIGEYCGYCFIEKNEIINYAVKNVGIFKTENEIDAKWIYYYLNSPEGINTLKSLRSGTSQPYLSLGVLRSLPILIPPTIRQKERIVNILSTIDDKIENNLATNQTLEEITRTLFKEWFVNFNYPNADGNLKHTEFGEIPESWSINGIGEICYVQNGYAFKSKDFQEQGEVGIIKIKNISGNVVDIQNTDFVDSSVVSSLDKKFKIESGSLLIAMTGAEVGKIGLVPLTEKNLWLNQRVGMFQEKIAYGNLFMYLLLSTDTYQTAIQNSALGSAQPNISASAIESIRAIIPPAELIEDFGKTIKPMFEKILDNLAENETLKTTRDSLLPKLMSGEIEVNG